AYTEGNVLFLEFAADGVYDVQVYNVGGMLVASKELSALAGQSAHVTLGTAGVYLVKAVKDGQVLRTVKVLSK
ncbi:MAG: T9SS type A sorting domain-containing protein, partial [Paramuribaculum sp.]|nr:T9SS type A sorting domain-containing protein [Paramuribaculum sp.]